VLAQQPVLTHYELQVSGAPKRTARVAKMAVQACSTTLDFRDKRTKKHFSKQVNLVLAREQDTTPKGEKPIEWLLLTNRPVATVEDINQIVFGYAQRWRNRRLPPHLEEWHLPGRRIAIAVCRSTHQVGYYSGRCGRPR